MSSITTAITQGFTGVSKYASSLQSVLSRSVAIASLPLDSLNAGLNTLGSKQSSLHVLDATFLSLQQSISSLQNTAKTGLLNSSISDAGIVSASIQPSASPASYTIEVTSLGSYSTALSGSGSSAVADPSASGLSSDATLNLSLGTDVTVITPSGSTLQDLVSAINSQASDKVQATVVNVGSGKLPDYRLSLRAVNLGTDSIDLADSSGSLLTSSTSGALANYKIDGLPDPISSTTRSVTLAPGVTLNLLGQSPSGVATTVAIVNSPTALNSALSQFANSYNAAVDAIAANHGTGAGALQGDSLLQSLSQVLHQLGNYSNGSPSSALANFGVTLDQTGHLSVNSAALTSAASADFQGLLTTIGTSSSGGFLKQATDLLASLNDPVTGSITGEEKTVASAITAQQKRIADEQTSINAIQTNLTAQIAKADAAIASLQSQLSYVTGLFAAYNGTSTSSNSLNNQ